MNSTKNTVITVSALAPERYDEQRFEYTGDNLTIIRYFWKGTQIAVVTNEYTVDKLTRSYRSSP